MKNNKKDGNNNSVIIKIIIIIVYINVIYIHTVPYAIKNMFDIYIYIFNKKIIIIIIIIIKKMEKRIITTNTYTNISKYQKCI